MKKKVLIVAPTAEARTQAKINLRERWGDEADIRTAGFEHAVGVCKDIIPHVVVLLPGEKGTVVYDQIRTMMPYQQIVWVGYDPLPATL